MIDTKQINMNGMVIRDHNLFKIWVKLCCLGLSRQLELFDKTVFRLTWSTVCSSLLGKIVRILFKSFYTVKSEFYLSNAPTGLWPHIVHVILFQQNAPRFVAIIASASRPLGVTHSNMYLLCVSMTSLVSKNYFYKIVSPRVFLFLLVICFFIITKTCLGKSTLLGFVKHGPHILHVYMRAIIYSSRYALL